MSVVYLETYVIEGKRWGIEDHADGRMGDEHFFHGEYREGRRKRFCLWRGGCGFGQCDTLEEARARVRDYAVQTSRENLERAQAALDTAKHVVDRLSAADLDQLQRFRAD